MKNKESNVTEEECKQDAIDFINSDRSFILVSHTKTGIQAIQYINNISSHGIRKMGEALANLSIMTESIAEEIIKEVKELKPKDMKDMLEGMLSMMREMEDHQDSEAEAVKEHA